MNENAFAPVAPAPVEAVKVVPLPSMPRGRGRPRKVIEVQTTTVRMPEDIHYKTRQLAMRSKLSMSDLIVEAVKEYAEKRGLVIS